MVLLLEYQLQECVDVTVDVNKCSDFDKFEEGTLNIVFSVTDYNCLAQILIVTHPCSITNNECKLNIICYSY
jgi:hypothetical protein